MEFTFYDEIKLAKVFRDREYNSGSHKVCQGCVFTNVPPVDCIHPEGDFDSPPQQSDSFCPHCRITIEDSGERFYLYDDKYLEKKVAELERILEMAWDE